MKGKERRIWKGKEKAKRSKEEGNLEERRVEERKMEGDEVNL